MRFLILLALLGAAMAVPKRNMRIVGGEPTTIQRYPYMSSMIYAWLDIWPVQSCGGSLITTTTVLSAAHCYLGDSPNTWQVRLGSTLASSGGSLHFVSELLIHPQYSYQTRDNDVAIVRLSTPATLSASINTVSIAGGNYNVPDGTQVFAIGWGALWHNGPVSDTLQHVDVNVINQNLCTERYAYLKTLPGHQNWPDITPRMLCVGILDVGGKDACEGDSGGPLTHPAAAGDVVVGIQSFNYDCAHPFYPSVSTRVSSFTDWIVNNA